MLALGETYGADSSWQALMVLCLYCGSLLHARCGCWMQGGWNWCDVKCWCLHYLLRTLQNCCTTSGGLCEWEAWGRVGPVTDMQPKHQPWPSASQGSGIHWRSLSQTWWQKIQHSLNPKFRIRVQIRIWMDQGPSIAWETEILFGRSWGVVHVFYLRSSVLALSA